MAQSHADVKTTLTTTGVTAWTTKELFGWTMGGGSEFAIMNRVSAKLEYLYYEYGSEHYTVDGNTDVYAKNRGNIFRAGVSYKLY